jgi:hypothetical protein
LSTTVGGIVAQRFGYPASFLALGAIAVLALALWIAARPITATARVAAPADAETATQAAA